MSAALKIAVLRANLTDRYFPAKHGVWDRVGRMLDGLGAELDVDVAVAGGEIADGATARRACDRARLDGADFILLVHGGFTMGDVAREVANCPLPTGVMAVPEPVRTGDVQLNNFVSLNMTMSIARGVRDLRNAPVAWFYGAPEDPALIGRLRTSLKALIAVKAFRGQRIGLVGGLAPTFYNMEVSTNALKERLGLEVVAHDMAEVTGRMAALPTERVDAELQAICAAAPAREVSDHQMALTAQCALALRDLAADGACDALAISDWPALQEHPGMHPGGAFTWLEEVDRLPCASEGDVLGAATQLLARAVTGRLGCLLDMTEPDLDTGRLLMWHGGGGPLFMADDAGAAWINHPMIGREAPDATKFGTIADFVFRPGPHTVFRVSREASAFFQMDANVVAQEPNGFDGCRGWMDDFRIAGEPASLGELIATVMAHGLEHHTVAVPGVHFPVLAEFAAWSGMRSLRRRPDRPHLAPEDFS